MQPGLEECEDSSPLDLLAKSRVSTASINSLSSGILDGFPLTSDMLEKLSQLSDIPAMPDIPKAEIARHLENQLKLKSQQGDKASKSVVSLESTQTKQPRSPKTPKKRLDQPLPQLPDNPSETTTPMRIAALGSPPRREKRSASNETAEKKAKEPVAVTRSPPTQPQLTATKDEAVHTPNTARYYSQPNSVQSTGMQRSMGPVPHPPAGRRPNGPVFATQPANQSGPPPGMRSYGHMYPPQQYQQYPRHQQYPQVEHDHIPAPRPQYHPQQGHYPVHHPHAYHPKYPPNQPNQYQPPANYGPGHTHYFPVQPSNGSWNSPKMTQPAHFDRQAPPSRPEWGAGPPTPPTYANTSRSGSRADVHNTSTDSAFDFELTSTRPYLRHSQSHSWDVSRPRRGKDVFYQHASGSHGDIGRPPSPASSDSHRSETATPSLGSNSSRSTLGTRTPPASFNPLSIRDHVEMGVYQIEAGKEDWALHHWRHAASAGHEIGALLYSLALFKRWGSDSWITSDWQAAAHSKFVDCSGVSPKELIAITQPPCPRLGAAFDDLTRVYLKSNHAQSSIAASFAKLLMMDRPLDS